MSLRHTGRERAYLVDEFLAADRDAGELFQLADNHHDRDARHVAHQHRARQQIGQKPEPRDAGQKAGCADEDGDGGRQGGVAPRVTHDERRQHGRRHQCGGGLRADGQLPRRAEHRIEDQRSQSCPQPRDRRQTRQAAVGHHLRDEVSGHSEAGEHVAAQPCPFVVPELSQPRGGDGKFHGGLIVRRPAPSGA